MSKREEKSIIYSKQFT